MQRKDPKVKVTLVTLPAAELKADGVATMTATAITDPVGSVVKWSIPGAGFGTTISAGGVIKAGGNALANDTEDVEVKAASTDGSSSKTAKFKLADAKFVQARDDYPKFVSSAYAVPNYTTGLNGKFDMAYSPGSKKATATVKVNFSFPDEPVPRLYNFFGLTNLADVNAAKGRQDALRQKFFNSIKSQWSGRYQFRNAREPQSIWSKLNPIDVKVDVVEVATGQHFKVTIKNKSTGGAAVGGGETKLFKGDDVPKPAFNPGTAAGELTRVQRNTPTPIVFARGKADIPAADAGKLAFLDTYLSRIRNPRFNVNIVGHASKTGKTADNQTLSEARANNVAAALGTTAGNHTVTSSGVGDTGATPDPGFQRVDISSAIPAGWQNLQDTTAHEFGHMIGLGDEYAAGGQPKATHYALVAKAFGNDYADQVAKRGDTDYASIMEGGNDVRVQHYVTFWDALVQTAATAADPATKFTHDDWRIIG